MSIGRALAVVAVLGLGAFAVTAYARQQDAAPAEPAGDAGSLWGAVDWSQFAPLDAISSAYDDLTSEVDFMSSFNTQPAYSAAANVGAFLHVLKRCEGTASQPDPYRVCYAYRHVIGDLSDHPAVTGEWRGETLTAQQCAGAGYGPGCVSTAAGAYQFTKPTWLAMKNKLGLADFSPASQDAAAVQKLRDLGAYARLAAGDLAGAVRLARGTWASLPGANYAGQGMRSMSDVLAWYSGAGGATA